MKNNQKLSVVLFASAFVLICVTLGRSQVMNTALFVALLSLLPAIAYFRSMTLASLATAFSSIIIGVYLLYDTALELVHLQRPSIGTMTLFGSQFWLGWAMIAVLGYMVFCAYVLDNRVAVKSASAGIIGLLLVAFGLWWGDAVAAGIMSVIIVLNGWHHLQRVLPDLDT